MSDKAAFIIAQATMLQAELLMMECANKEREDQGKALAYGEEQIAATIDRYQILLHNNCLNYLQGA